MPKKPQEKRNYSYVSQKVSRVSISGSLIIDRVDLKRKISTYFCLWFGQNKTFNRKIDNE